MILAGIEMDVSPFHAVRRRWLSFCCFRLTSSGAARRSCVEVRQLVGPLSARAGVARAGRCPARMLWQWPGARAHPGQRQPPMTSGAPGGGRHPDRGNHLCRQGVRSRLRAAGSIDYPVRRLRGVRRHRQPGRAVSDLVISGWRPSRRQPQPLPAGPPTTATQSAGTGRSRPSRSPARPPPPRWSGRPAGPGHGPRPRR